MSRNINLSDELYERLEQQAARQGQTIEDYLDHLTACDTGEQSSQEQKVAERDMVRNRLLARGLLVAWPEIEPDLGTSLAPGAQPEVSEHPPITVKGAPLSQTVIEDRR